MAKSPPPEDLARRLEVLRRAAQTADRAVLVLALQAIVASYQPVAEGRPLEPALAAQALALRVVQGGAA